MAQELTNKQINQANRYMVMVTGKEMSRVEMERLATHLQYAPPQYAENVVDGMLQAWQQATIFEEKSGTDGMSAALGYVLDRVCAESKKILSIPGPSGSDRYQEWFVGQLRASLLKSVVPTLEEEIETYLKRELNIEGCETAIAADLIAIVTRRAGGSHE